MTYLQSLEKLYAKPTSPNAKGVDMPSVMRRADWPDGKVLLLAKNQPRIAFCAVNTSTGSHQAPELKRELTNIRDLGSKDWEFIDAAAFF